MAKTDTPAQEMQITISFELPRHEDRTKELALQGEIATRVSGIVDHLREQFKSSNVEARIFSQVVTVRAPRKRRTKAEIQSSKTNGAQATHAQEETPKGDIPQFLKRPAAEEAQSN